MSIADKNVRDALVKLSASGEISGDRKVMRGARAGAHLGSLSGLIHPLAVPVAAPLSAGLGAALTAEKGRENSAALGATAGTLLGGGVGGALGRKAGSISGRVADAVYANPKSLGIIREGRRLRLGPGGLGQMLGGAAGLLTGVYLGGVIGAQVGAAAGNQPPSALSKKAHAIPDIDHTPTLARAFFAEVDEIDKIAAAGAISKGFGWLAGKLVNPVAKAGKTGIQRGATSGAKNFKLKDPGSATLGEKARVNLANLALWGKRNPLKGTAAVVGGGVLAGRAV